MISYLFVNGKEIYKLKEYNKSVNFSNQICLRSISNKFDYVEVKEVSLNRNVYNVLVSYYANDKSDILNIQKYLIVKNNIK